MGYYSKSKTKRGRKQDARRIALTSPYERRYVKKLAKKLIKICNEDMKSQGVKSKTFFAIKKGYGCKSMATSSIKRIAKALLKAL